MKILYSMVLVVAFAGCGSEVRDAQARAMSEAIHASIANAIVIYEKEYDELPPFGPRELFETLTGKNEKQILFISSVDYPPDGDGRLVNSFGNPIRIVKKDNSYYLVSKGEDEHLHFSNKIEIQNQSIEEQPIQPPRD